MDSLVHIAIVSRLANVGANVSIAAALFPRTCFLGNGHRRKEWESRHTHDSNQVPISKNLMRGSLVVVYWRGNSIILSSLSVSVKERDSTGCNLKTWFETSNFPTDAAYSGDTSIDGRHFASSGDDFHGKEETLDPVTSKRRRWVQRNPVPGIRRLGNPVALHRSRRGRRRGKLDPPSTEIWFRKHLA